MIVDCHVHMNPFWLAKEEALDVFRRHQSNFADAEEMARDPTTFVDYLDSQNVDVAVCVNYVSDDIVGYPWEVNEFAAEYRDAAPDRLLAFAGIRLSTGVDDVHEQLDRIISDLALDGVKIHPPHQDIAPNAYRDPPVGTNHKGIAAVYERCAEAELPVMIHTGTSIFPGARNVHTNPMAVDDVCIDFDCDVIMAHGGRPLYYDEAFFLYRRHDTLYFDISSLPPSHLLNAFPRLEEIAHKTLFGSDWPAPMIPDISENIETVRNLDLAGESVDDILGGTAERVLDL